jgi:diguanylate cyclase
MIADALVSAERLSAALDRDELIAHYQPILDLHSGRFTRAEALARWQHPTAGLVAAGDFVPAVEHAGLSHRLSDRMLAAVLADRVWEPAGRRVSVNVSASELDARFAKRLTARLAASRTPACKLVMEVTESEAMQSLDTATCALSSLREAGLSVVLDDFGTGFSSLARLKALPINGFKLDRRFIADVATDKVAWTTVSAIVSIAIAHGLKTVAEGIETAEQLKVVSSLGCDFAQGFYLARPMAAQDARLLLDPA